MNSFIKLCQCELIKMKRSWVPRMCLLGFMLGPTFAFIFMVILQNPDMLQNLSGQGGKFDLEHLHPDWQTFLTIIIQAFAVGGGIVFGFLVAYVFGREHAEGNFIDLLSLKQSRFAIFVAKYVVSILVCLVIALIVFALSLALGALSGISGFSTQLLLDSLGAAGTSLGIHMVLMSAVAMAAFVLRGYLPALGLVVGTMVLAQICGSLGLGVYFPWAIPALAVGLGGPLQTPQAFSYAIVALVFVASLFFVRRWLLKSDHT